MRVVNLCVVVLVATVLFSCSGQGVTNKSLDTELDSVSYAAGLDMGVGVSGQLKQGFSEADIDLFVQGFLNGVDSTNLKMSGVQAKALVSKYFTEKQQREAAHTAEENFGEAKKEGEAFIAANKTKEGVQSTESGLQYIVMTEGSGDKPTPQSKVKVHYHGTLTDGTVFDSSVDRGEPTEFGVGQVIKGWTEGLQLMSVGSKFKFFIPQELAYGANPRPGGVIKPFMPLIFEVELLEIK
jgi:FKBP-type peptidyl-prolyl cis-trans isomerase FklB